MVKAGEVKGEQALLALGLRVRVRVRLRLRVRLRFRGYDVGIRV